MDWHKRYMSRIAWLVGPLMIGQLVAGVGLLLLDASLSKAAYLTLVATTWVLTGLVAAPLHRKLQETGKDRECIIRLIAWNWLRTALWTAVVFL